MKIMPLASRTWTSYFQFFQIDIKIMVEAQICGVGETLS
jgi:hypothetical protein